MHHPDIYDLLSIIEDYFIFTDTKFRCQIEPVICPEFYHSNDPNQNATGCKGLRISRQLSRGRIEVNILGTHKDSDLAKFCYFTDEDPDQPAEIFEAPNIAYNTEVIRAAIRKIVIFDRDRKVENELQVE